MKTENTCSKEDIQTLSQSFRKDSWKINDVILVSSMLLRTGLGKTITLISGNRSFLPLLRISQIPDLMKPHRHRWKWIPVYALSWLWARYKSVEQQQTTLVIQFYWTHQSNPSYQTEQVLEWENLEKCIQKQCSEWN